MNATPPTERINQYGMAPCRQAFIKITALYEMNYFRVAIILALLAAINSVSGTEVKWTGNKDGPEAARVPRSQKYWDENNIERPDYAKTDAELREERKAKGGPAAVDVQNESGGSNVKTLLLIFGFFLGLWWIIFQKAVGAGHRLGGSSKSQFSFGKPSVLGGGTGASLEEKARLARLAKFEDKKQD